MKTTITVITATYNSGETITELIRSLLHQSDMDFKWIVVDGGSTDSTLKLIENSGILSVLIDSRPDFGIYDAINRGVSLCDTDYYIVCGSDDEFYPDAIKLYKQSIISSRADFITCCIDVNGVISIPGNGSKSWLKGLKSYISGHSVGLAVKTELHARFGLYSRKFPIAADQLFVLSSLYNGATLSKQNFTAGKFGTNGVSSVDYLGTVTEFFRVQIILGHNKYVQLMLLVLRLLKGIWRL